MDGFSFPSPWVGGKKLLYSPPLPHQHNQHFEGMPPKALLHSNDRGAQGAFPANRIRLLLAAIATRSNYMWKPSRLVVPKSTDGTTWVQARPYMDRNAPGSAGTRWISIHVWVNLHPSQDQSTWVQQARQIFCIKLRLEFNPCMAGLSLHFIF